MRSREKIQKGMRVMSALERLHNEVEKGIKQEYLHLFIFSSLARGKVIDGGDEGMVVLRRNEGKEGMVKGNIEYFDIGKKEEWYHLLRDRDEIRELHSDLDEYVIWIELDTLPEFVKEEWDRYIRSDREWERKEEMKSHLGRKEMVEESAYVVIWIEELEIRWVLNLQEGVEEVLQEEVKLKNPYEEEVEWGLHRGILIRDQDLKEEGKRIVDVYREEKAEDAWRVLEGL